MTDGGTRKRNFPLHSLEEALIVAQKIQDEMGGKPIKRLLLAEALGIKPSSSNFRDLLSASFRYGLTDGTEKASEISLTEIGKQATQSGDAHARIAALRGAAATPPVFARFYADYADKKIPSREMIGKILASVYSVPEIHTEECARIIEANGRMVSIIRDIGGSAHVLLDAEPVVDGDVSANAAHEDDETDVQQNADEIGEVRKFPGGSERPVEDSPLAIFLAHGKRQGALEKLQKILSSFQIPYKVALQEANLGRPIPQKVKETMAQCSSAILIFTRDEKFIDKDGNEIWRPSENVVYELGAASYAYEDRVVIFKEKGIDFPANFESIGYIEFEEDSIDAKATDLLKELIGFGLVKLTAA